MMATLKARVQQGMALLDMHCPGWQKTVDIERLDMGNSINGLIEQIYQCSYVRALQQLAINADEAMECGFDIAENTPESQYEKRWQQLTEAWKQAIKEQEGTKS
jgi:hypothetical protein